MLLSGYGDERVCIRPTETAGACGQIVGWRLAAPGQLLSVTVTFPVRNNIAAVP
jgi:hypothetical protein